MIYLDNDYKCYTEPAENLKAFENNPFDGKCKTFIEGHRYIPTGETWTREDGIQFKGEMVSPWKDYSELKEAQLIYEKELAEQALNILIEGAENK